MALPPTWLAQLGESAYRFVEVLLEMLLAPLMLLAQLLEVLV